jgi:KDO2-lipid IV(A) lauroyltransferase
LETSQASSNPVTVRHRLEYAAVAGLVWGLGALPRSFARRLGAGVGALSARLSGRLSSTGVRNLKLAFPDRSDAERQAILQGEFRNLGWQIAEFCQMRKYSADFVRSDVMRYEGLENFLDAEARGKGVLVLTGHLGAWELSSFVHSLLGHPMGMVIRRLDNPLVDKFVNDIRCKHGNRVLHKDDFARGLLHAMHRGETVGILMDTNMTPPQGVFAATTEAYVRRYPEQWLWLHRRWKTRPAGEPPLYGQPVAADGAPVASLARASGETPAA